MTLYSFNDHVLPVKHNGVSYHFRSIAAALKFAALVGANAERPACNAWDCHERAYRLGDLPACVERYTRKARMKVSRTPPPKGNKPPRALRVVKGKEKPAEEAEESKAA